MDKVPIDKDEVKRIVNELNCNYLTIIDGDYPECLKGIYKPPFVLFYKGDISLLDNSKKRIAVIGSRLNSDYGEKACKNICKDLVKEENLVVVSGFAKGIDSISHLCAVENNGYTIAVLGCGLNVTYPKENVNLKEQILLKGLLISEYPPDSPPLKDHFPERNRILAGISDGVVVIEAKEKSGTMNTVYHALEDGKQVFCVPDKFDSKSGCNKLIKEGAKLVENSKDILEDL